LKGLTVRILKTILAAGFALSLAPVAFSQDDAAQTAKNEAQLQQLVNLYATATLGWNVEQRCQHLGDELGGQFNDNYQVIDEFMTLLLVDEVVEKIKSDTLSDLDTDETFECDSSTIDFASETFRLTRDLAANIRELTGPEAQ